MSLKRMFRGTSRRRRMHFEALEDRRLLAFNPRLVGLDLPPGSGLPSYMIVERSTAQPHPLQISGAPGAAGEDSSQVIFDHTPNILTVIVDFVEPAQGTVVDAIGNNVGAFDVTSFGFAATDFDLVTQAVLDTVESHYHDIAKSDVFPQSPIPPDMELAIEFEIGNVGTPPANGSSDFYYVLVGTDLGGPCSGALGCNLLDAIRDPAGVPGAAVGTVTGSIYSDVIQGLGALTPPNALSIGDIDFTRHAIAGTTSHEIGHGVSLLHINKQGVITPNGFPPIMGTGAIDTPNQDRIGPREFSFQGQNAEAGNATQFHINQLVGAIGLHRPTSQIRGLKFSDFDSDGLFEPADLEQGMGGFTIYIDANNNAQLDPGEISTVTAADGTYILEIDDPGTYIVREVQQSFHTQTFPPTGFHVVTIPEIGDDANNIDFGNLPAFGSIRGVKFLDEDSDGVRDSGEPGQPGVTIQLFDRFGELFAETVTGPGGVYAFENIPPIRYTVDEVVPPNQTKTFPSPLTGGVHTINLQPTQIRVNVNFGNFGPRGSISGRKFNDVDGDGIHDDTELGIKDIVIYVDRNEDGVFNLGEPTNTTDQFGRYQIPNMVPGEYIVRELIPPGTTQTNPGGSGEHVVVVIAGQETENVNFFNRTFRDFGDAPAPYPTLFADGGASHGIRPGFFLGSGVDAENDGQPNATATGDDNPGGSFALPVNIPVAAAAGPVQPVSAATANLDAQGGLDLVVVNPVSSSDPTVGSVTVLRNLGQGIFSDPVEYIVGVMPSRVAFGDFDGDGSLDLAVSNTGSDNVSVLLNRGDGTFESAISVLAGPGPRGIAAGDLDGDGDIDIAVSNTGVGVETVSILLNETEPDDDVEFDDPLEVDVNEGSVADVTLGDIDRDGDLDLVTANEEQNTVSVLRNNGVVAGEPTFAAPQNYFVGNGPVHVIVANLNRDNRPDIATANRDSGTVSVLLQRVTGGTFLPQQSVAVGGQPTSVAAADIDGDGDNDLIAATGAAGVAPVLINDSNGNFTLGNPLIATGNPVFVVAAEFNGDGGPDVITVNQAAGNISLIGTAGDDEDGVQFSPQPLRPGRTAVIDVTASEAGLLNAWIDFNLDGDWNDPGERIFTNRAVEAGLNRLVISVPATATVGMSFARFRLSDQPLAGPGGPAATGEVEDYRVGIGVLAGDTPSSFQNPQNALDVNADGLVTLFDALLLVNALQANGPHALPEPPPPGAGPPPFLDPSGDGFVTLNDVLLVINGVLVQMALLAEPESAEGEADSAAAPQAILVLPPRSPWEAHASTGSDVETAGAPPALVEADVDSSPPTAARRDADEAYLPQDDEDELDDALEAIAGDVTAAWGAGATG